MNICHSAKIIKVTPKIYKNEKSFLELTRENTDRMDIMYLKDLKKIGFSELGEIFSCIQAGSSPHKPMLMKTIDGLVDKMNSSEAELNLSLSKLNVVPVISSRSSRKKKLRAEEEEIIKKL